MPGAHLLEERTNGQPEAATTRPSCLQLNRALVAGVPPAALQLRACKQLRADAGLGRAQGVLPGELRQTCTACATTLLLEFGTLSRLTGDPTYERAAAHAVRCLPPQLRTQHERRPSGWTL